MHHSLSSHLALRGWDVVSRAEVEADLCWFGIDIVRLDSLAPLGKAGTLSTSQKGPVLNRVVDEAGSLLKPECLAGRRVIRPPSLPL